MADIQTRYALRDGAYPEKEEIMLGSYVANAFSDIAILGPNFDGDIAAYNSQPVRVGLTLVSKEIHDAKFMEFMEAGLGFSFPTQSD